MSVATENGVTVPTKVTLIPTNNPGEQPKGVNITGDGWKIQIVGSKTVVKGTPTDPTNITIVLIQGLTASTSGTGFKPGTVANVYLYSSKILLGKALVGTDGTFKATFPVSTTIAIGPHTMQVVGIALTGDDRKADVGLLVESDPNKAIKRLDRIYFALNYSGLTKANKGKLAVIAKTVNRVKFKKLWVFGYTDIQTGVDNKALSKRRATTVKAYLKRLLPKVVIQIKYFGPADPLTTARTKAAFAQNRRDEIFGQKGV